MKNKARTNIGMWHSTNFVCQTARKYIEWKISLFGTNEEIQEEIDMVNNVEKFLRSDNWKIYEFYK